jgi:hypothetical protein
MDYRLIVVDRISWCARKACYGAGKVQFQTPPATYCSTPSPKLGVGVCDIVLKAVSPRFCKFIQEIEASAQDVLGDDLDGRQLISAVSWDGELRFTLFQRDTLLFDIDGNVVDVWKEDGVCACLVSLVGVWLSARSWGLKFAIKEMKELNSSKVPVPTTGWAFREEHALTQKPSDWLFRDE